MIMHIARFGDLVDIWLARDLPDQTPIRTPDDLPVVAEYRDDWPTSGQCALVIRPATAEEVAA